MHRLVLGAFLLIIPQLNSQTNAVTEYGDQVILYDNGTWEHINEEGNLKEELAVNPQIFVKPENSGFLLKSSILNVGIWINAKKWKFGKAQDNEEAEYEIELKGEDLYGTIISERISIPLESLREIAYSNFKDTSSDVKIDSEEYRMVNSLKILMLEMSGTFSGISFTYKGYYYSNEKGTIQIVLYTSKSLMKQYDEEVELLLNGFVEL